MATEYKLSYTGAEINEKLGKISQLETAIADKLDVQPNWNQSDETAPDYIKNRTHYESIGKNIIIPETVDTVVSGGFNFMHYDHTLLDWTMGNTVYIKWDGVEYEGICGEHPDAIMGYIIKIDGKYRVWFTEVGSIISDGNSYLAVGDTHTYEIYTYGTIAKQLDQKFVPNIADWSVNDENATGYIKNKPFWTDDPVETVIVPETTVEIINGDFVEEAIDITLIEGVTYTVAWNGIKYECTCYNYDDSLVIGNNECWGGNDGNGEPFLVSNYDGITAINVYEEGTYTISISTMLQKVHKIPSEYVGTDWNQNDPKETGYIANRTHYEEGEKIILLEQTIEGFSLMEEPIYGVENPFSMAYPIEGASYIVNWDGIDYTVTASTTCGVMYLGNENYVHMSSGGDIPFAITFADSIYLVTESTENSHIVSIKALPYVHQLDVKYLPIMEETIGEVVFESENVISDDEYIDSTYKRLSGKYKLTVEGTSEIIEFIDNDDESIAECDCAFIATWDGGIYIFLPNLNDGETHSVKIEEFKNVIKAEHLPDDIGAQADWEQNDETAPDYVKNRPFYKNTEEVIYIDEQTVTLTASGNYSNATLSYTNYIPWDAICKVTFDGVVYDNIAAYESGGDMCIYVVFTTENGEKISICESSSIQAPASLAGEHTIKVSIVESEYHKIDTKYIDFPVTSVNGKTGNVNITANSINAATQTAVDKKMDKNNPVGTGSFSMNRKSGSTTGDYSHAEGYNTTAAGDYSHAEGYNTTAAGDYSHAEGYDTTAAGDYSHAEGYNTTAAGDYSHAEGYNTTAAQRLQHVFGEFNIVPTTQRYVQKITQITSQINLTNSGLIYYADSYEYDPVSGLYTLINYKNGVFNHEEFNKYVIDRSPSGTKMYYVKQISNYCIGSGVEYTIIENNDIIVIGNGVSDTNRSNSHAFDVVGDAWHAGDVYVGSTSGTNKDEGSRKLIANGDTELILTSSTEGSTKQFKITVDDNGTLTATEVTE